MAKELETFLTKEWKVRSDSDLGFGKRRTLIVDFSKNMFKVLDKEIS